MLNFYSIANIYIYLIHMNRGKPAARGGPAKKTTERPGLTSDEI